LLATGSIRSVCQPEAVDIMYEERSVGGATAATSALPFMPSSNNHQLRSSSQSFFDDSKWRVMMTPRA